MVNITKLFLFQFGFLNIQNSGNPIFLEENDELRENLKNLDSIGERTLIKVKEIDDSFKEIRLIATSLEKYIPMIWNRAMDQKKQNL